MHLVDMSVQVSPVRCPEVTDTTEEVLRFPGGRRHNQCTTVLSRSQNHWVHHRSRGDIVIVGYGISLVNYLEV